MNTLDRTDKIDDFLLGKMSEKEKNEFEKLLSGGDTSLDSKQLKQEMELQEDIILAIKERGLKEMLQKEEAKLREEKAAQRRVAALRKEEITLVEEDITPRRGAAAAVAYRFPLLIGSSSVFAVAAIITGFLFISSITKVMLNESTQWASQVPSSVVRGSSENDFQDSLSSAYEAISENNWDDAFTIATELQQTAEFYSSTESEYAQEELSDYINEADWIIVQYHMHEGHVFKAKHLLKKIANSDSFYQEQAQSILNKL